MQLMRKRTKDYKVTKLFSVLSMFIESLSLSRRDGHLIDYSDYRRR